jgi:hypothetical protein
MDCDAADEEPWTVLNAKVGCDSDTAGYVTDFVHTPGDPVPSGRSDPMYIHAPPADIRDVWS